jgi:hypothetical protein
MRRAFRLSAMTVIAMSLAAGAHAQDRYGPAPSNDANVPAPMATLSWPGKTAAPPAPIPPHAAAVPSPAPQAAPTSLYDPPPPRWRAAETAPAAAIAPAAQPAQTLQQTANGAPPRRYSLARQYGVEPDPIALSPQFLASSPQADMATPPPLPPPHTIGASSANMSTAASTSQLRQAQEAASDTQTTTLGN